jgi:tetratricopeptide (TPR) repeat protein
MSTLTSSEAGYAQKQAAWEQLRSSGKLDQAILELEQQATANSNAPEYPAALGQAYLHKAGTLSDIREQGILGMKADQSFDAALNLEPNNWEAGFWKATAMSYWPPQLGKGQEVIQRFVNLVKLQEGQTAQPQFAQTYLSLGDEYQKQGYQDYARQIWNRGATLFPSENRFGEKLSQAQTQPTAAR